MKYTKGIFFIFILIFFSCKKELFKSAEKLSVGSPFQDHMVLQREVEVPLFGRSDKGAKIEIEIGEETYSTKTNDDGEWRVFLPSQNAGGPHTIKINVGEKQVIFSDIYFGDVWLCSGQSNMEMQLNKTENGTEETMNADFPFIRHFGAKGYGKKEPQTEWPEGEWEICTPSTAGEFTGAGYYFAKYLHGEIDVPIGLLNATWAATRIEEWMSEESFGPGVPPPPVSLDWDTEWDIEKNPYRFFNQYINPMTRLPIKGILWYQGESNAKLQYATEYEAQLKALINHWRGKWGQPDLPFILVQLSSWEPNNGVNRWADLRASQTAALELSNTAMALTYDISPEHDIHPPNKKDLGYRLSLSARRLVYGEDIVASGPVFETAIWNEVEGYSILKFSSIGSGLSEQPIGFELKGFEAAGNNGEFFPVEAWIENNEVIVRAPFDEAPKIVRYAWSNAPLEANLYNLENLPALPFLYEF